MQFGSGVTFASDARRAHLPSLRGTVLEITVVPIAELTDKTGTGRAFWATIRIVSERTTRNGNVGATWVLQVLTDQLTAWPVYPTFKVNQVQFRQTDPRTCMTTVTAKMVNDWLMPSVDPGRRNRGRLLEELRKVITEHLVPPRPS